MPNRCEPRRTARAGVDITLGRLLASLVAVGCLAFGLPGAGQLLDQTIGDIVDQQVADQVEEDVAQAVEQTVESSVAQQVEQDIANTVEQTVESSVAQQVEQDIANTVEQTVESGVAQQIEQDVAGAVEQVLESEVVDAVQQQVESGVVGTVATQLESSVAGEIGEQLLDTVEGEIGNVADEIGDTVRGVAEGVQPIVGIDNPLAPATPAEPFVADVDPLGRAVERETWIILVPAEHAARIATWGFTIRERQDLAALDRVLLRVAAPENRDIAQAALELALDAPGTQVDFNHLYRPGAETAAATTVAGVPAARAGAAQPTSAPALSVGIVDTAVASEHDALRNADIVQRDFVPFAAERPTGHGTAVASVLVGEGGKLRPQLPGGRVYAASVFFADTEGNDATTAASLTVASEWLVAEGVRVINMSLAGPPNRVLEATIAALIERGAVIVAAVGNNGPNGPPLYPAAYANVVAVTAIDAAHRIYRYANRGPHVVFAAPGVGIPAAKSGGGYRDQTGTSFAAPYAAAVIARTAANRTGTPASEVVAELKHNTVDLGAKEFDSVFGFGLIAPFDAVRVTASR